MEEQGAGGNEPGYMHFYHFLEPLCFAVATIADLLIIWAFLRNKKMQTRTNMLILNWAINNILFILMEYFIKKILKASGTKLTDQDLEYIMTHIIFFFRFIAIGIIFMIIVNKTVRIKTIYNRMLQVLLYATAIVCTVIHGFVNRDEEIQYFLIHMTFLLFYGLVLTMIHKELQYHCTAKSKTLSNKTKHRMMIGRIYTYNWFFFMTFNAVTYPHKVEDRILYAWKFFYLSGVVTACHMLMYLIQADENFKMSFLNIFRRGANKQAYDDAINYGPDSVGGPEIDDGVKIVEAEESEKTVEATA